MHEKTSKPKAKRVGVHFKFRPETIKRLRGASQKSGATMTRILERLIESYAR